MKRIVFVIVSLMICWGGPAYVMWAIMAENACVEGHPEAEWGPFTGCTSTILADDQTRTEG